MYVCTYIVHSTYVRVYVCTYIHIHVRTYFTVLTLGKIKIHFDGWTCRYDYWSDADTLDLHPVGWCERNGWEIQKPGERNRWPDSLVPNDCVVILIV